MTTMTAWCGEEQDTEQDIAFKGQACKGPVTFLFFLSASGRVEDGGTSILLPLGRPGLLPNCAFREQKGDQAALRFVSEFPLGS
jgi:hypothetical protein